MGLGFGNHNDRVGGTHYKMPDYNFIKRNQIFFHSLVITHGHLDHIGGIIKFLLYFQRPIRIVSSTFVAELLKIKLASYKESYVVETIKKIETFKDNTPFNIFSDLMIRPVFITHSIPQNSSFFVYTKKFNIFHSGDFKIDFNPSGRKINFLDILNGAKQPVDAMLCDSTRSGKNQFSDTGKSILQNFEHEFSLHANKRIFITAFSSHIDRLLDLIKLAQRFGRKVCFLGRSMRDYMQACVKSKLVGEKIKNVFFKKTQVARFKPNELLFICTGCQGETNSAFGNLTNDPDSKLDKNDLVIFSANIIPGNETSVFCVLENLLKRGVTVKHSALDEKNKFHVSGHGYAKDIKFLIGLIKPKYFIPIHGEMYHQYFNSKCALRMGIDSNRVIIPSNSDCLIYVNYNQTSGSGNHVFKKNSCVIKHVKNIFVYRDFFYDSNGMMLEHDNCTKRKMISQFGLITIFYKNVDRQFVVLGWDDCCTINSNLKQFVNNAISEIKSGSFKTMIDLIKTLKNKMLFYYSTRVKFRVQPSKLLPFIKCVLVA